jgi:hypothetical protein
MLQNRVNRGDRRPDKEDHDVNNKLHSHHTHCNSAVCGHVTVPGGLELQTAQEHRGTL